MTKSKPIFRQVDAHKYSKLGVRRKKKQKYRKPTGRDNKIRLNYAGRVRKVKVGFKNQKSGRTLVEGKKPVMVNNIIDLKNVGEGIGIIGKIGDKKRKEIAEYVLKNKISLYRFNAEKVLKDIEEKMKAAKEKKEKREAEKKARDKKAKDKEKKEAEKKDKEADKSDKKEDKLEEKVEGTANPKQDEASKSASKEKIVEDKSKSPKDAGDTKTENKESKEDKKENEKNKSKEESK